MRQQGLESALPKPIQPLRQGPRPFFSSTPMVSSTVASSTQGIHLSRSQIPDFLDHDYNVPPAELNRLCQIERLLPDNNPFAASFLHEVRNNMSSQNIQSYVYNNISLLIVEMIKDILHDTNSNDETRAFCNKLLDLVRFDNNDFLTSNEMCYLCWLDLSHPRLVHAHWQRCHPHLNIDVNTAQKKYILQCFNIEIPFGREDKHPMIQEIFTANTDEENILYSRATPTLNRIAYLLKIYISGGKEDEKMDYLTKLFRVPPPNHSDNNALFSHEPTPSGNTSPASSSHRHLDSRQSIPLQDQISDEVDLQNASNHSHALLFPNPGDFNLPPSIPDDVIEHDMGQV